MSTALAPEIATKAYADAGQSTRAKLERYYGKEYPAQDDEQERKVAYIKRLRDQGEMDALARYRQGTRNLLYVNGRQRLTWNKRAKAWEELPLVDEHDVRVSMNFIKPALRARMQRMTSGPVQFAITPPSNSLEDRDRAKIGVNFLQAAYQRLNMREKVTQALDLAFSCGFAALKSFWNRDLGPLTPAMYRQVKREPMLDETGQPILDGAGQPVTQVARDPATGQPVIEDVYVNRERQIVERADQAFQFRPGDTDCAVRTMFNIRLNPDAMAWDPGAGLRWLIDTDLVALSRLRELWPDHAEQIQEGSTQDQMLTLERMAAGAATVASWAQAFPGLNAPNKQNAGLGVLHEHWQLPDECFPAGRCLTLVNDLAVYDGAFPQGVFPYVPLFDEPAPLTPYGRPCVNDAVSPQDVINRQWTAIDAEMQLQGFGQYVSWDVPGVPEQITPESRKVVRIPMRTKFAGRSIRDIFHRIEPGGVGADRWNMIETARSALNDILGFHEVSRGQTPPGVDSGVAIQYLLEEERGQLLPASHALEDTLSSWGDVQLQIARWGYADDVERWLPVDRPDLGVQLETVTGKQLPDPKSITVSLEGFKPHSPVAFRAEVRESMKEGLIDPRKALQLLDLGQGISPALESETRHYVRARRINLLIQQGQIVVQPMAPIVDPATGQPLDAEPQFASFMPDGTPVVLDDDDDHIIHLRVLDEIALDDTQKKEVREVALIIKQQRRGVLAAMVPPAPTDVPPA